MGFIDFVFDLTQVADACVHFLQDFIFLLVVHVFGQDQKGYFEQFLLVIGKARHFNVSSLLGWDFAFGDGFLGNPQTIPLCGLRPWLCLSNLLNLLSYQDSAFRKSCSPFYKVGLLHESVSPKRIVNRETLI